MNYIFTENNYVKCVDFLRDDIYDCCSLSLMKYMFFFFIAFSNVSIIFTFQILIYFFIWASVMNLGQPKSGWYGMKSV